MRKYKESIIEKIITNCLEKDDCLIWRGKYDNFGNPVHETVRHANKNLIRQDELIYEECFPEASADGELIHTCGNRGCLNPEHMKILKVKSQEYAEYDRMKIQTAKKLFSIGKTIDEIKFATGLTTIRLKLFLKPETHSNTSEKPAMVSPPKQEESVSEPQQKPAEKVPEVKQEAKQEQKVETKKTMSLEDKIRLGVGKGILRELPKPEIEEQRDDEVILPYNIR